MVGKFGIPFEDIERLRNGAPLGDQTWKFIRSREEAFGQFLDLYPNGPFHNYFISAAAQRQAGRTGRYALDWAAP